jgi:L-lactate dehydrogenase complex protein LldF
MGDALGSVQSRDLPEMPAEPFRDWWKKNRT